MSTVIDERQYTAEELLTLPHADRYELRHGILVERDMGTESNWLAGRVLFLISLFLETHQLGYPFGSETSYACFPDDPRHAPRPDVSVIRFGRLPDEKLPKGHCKIRPDLVVEVVSPNDTAEEVSDKVVDFQSVGVPLIWVIYPGTRRVLIHRLASDQRGRVSELTEADTISGEDVLPGFTCAVSEFFRLPRPAEQSAT
jgi:Uma2 family endonuclease